MLSPGRTALIGAVLICTLVAPSGRAHPDLSAAVTALSERIAAAPEDANLAVARADLYRRHGDWQAALADFDTAERLGLDAQALQFGRGRVHLDAGDYERALACFNALLALQPDHVGALVARASVPTRAPAAAAGDLDRALRLTNTPTPEIYLQRGRLLLRTGTHGTERALSSIDEAIDRLGPLVSLVEFGVETSVAGRDYERAGGFIARLPPAVRNSARWLARGGDLLRLAGHDDRARREYAAALAAIESLPATRRHTRAVRDLEARVRAALADTG